jgi:hypothetical protein
MTLTRYSFFVLFFFQFHFLSCLVFCEDCSRRTAIIPWLQLQHVNAGDFHDGITRTLPLTDPVRICDVCWLKLKHFISNGADPELLAAAFAAYASSHSPSPALLAAAAANAAPSADDELETATC